MTEFVCLLTEMSTDRYDSVHGDAIPQVCITQCLRKAQSIGRARFDEAPSFTEHELGEAINQQDSLRINKHLEGLDRTYTERVAVTDEFGITVRAERVYFGCGVGE